MYSSSPRLAELACRIGFGAVWIEMEHGPTDFATAETICYAVRASGGVPLLRLPDANRNHVLKALEIGAQIVVVPMVNNRETACQIVQHGKFPPLGRRGFNSSTSGAGFGLSAPESMFRDADTHSHLFAQIETREAVESLDEICQVDGLSGVFVGPYDLSADMKLPGQVDDPQVIRVVSDVIRRARMAGKLAGILVRPGRLLDAAVEAGAQLLIVGGDVAELRCGWRSLLQQCKQLSKEAL